MTQCARWRNAATCQQRNIFQTSFQKSAVQFLKATNYQGCPMEGQHPQQGDRDNVAWWPYFEEMGHLRSISLFGSINQTLSPSTSSHVCITLFSNIPCMNMFWPIYRWTHQVPTIHDHQPLHQSFPSDGQNWMSVIHSGPLPLVSSSTMPCRHLTGSSGLHPFLRTNAPNTALRTYDASRKHQLCFSMAAHMFSVVASALGIPLLPAFLKAVFQVVLA